MTREVEINPETTPPVDICASLRPEIVKSPLWDADFGIGDVGRAKDMLGLDVGTKGEPFPQNEALEVRGRAKDCTSGRYIPLKRPGALENDASKAA